MYGAEVGVFVRKEDRNGVGGHQGVREMQWRGKEAFGVGTKGVNVLGGDMLNLNGFVTASVESPMALSHNLKHKSSELYNYGVTFRSV